MMKFVKVIVYAIPILLAAGVLALPFYWVMNKLNNDPDEGTNRERERGCAAGCLLTMANLILLIAYVILLVWSAKFLVGLMEQVSSRF